MTELLRFMEWTPAFRRVLWETDGVADGGWEHAPAEGTRRAGEFALGYCELELAGPERAELQKRYRFRPIATQLRHALERWHAEPLREVPEYSLAVALMEARPGAQSALAPLTASAFVEFLLERARGVLDQVQDVSIRAELERVLGQRFSAVSYAPGPGFSRARVLIGHELEVRAWPHPSELIGLLFHELSHASAVRAARMDHWSRENDPESWVELGIFEEFRARALTAIFEAAWKRSFQQYGAAREPALRSVWDGLRRGLSPALPEQKAAYAGFFEVWDTLSVSDQEVFLNELIRSKSPSGMSK